MFKIARNLVSATLALAALTASTRADFLIDVPDVTVLSGDTAVVAVNEYVSAGQTTNLFVTATGIHIKFDPTLLAVTNIRLGDFDATDYTLTVNMNPGVVEGGDIVVSISLQGGHAAHALSTTPHSVLLFDVTAATVAETTMTPINLVLSAPINPPNNGANLATNLFTRNLASSGAASNRPFNPTITNGANDIPDGVVTISSSAVPEPGSIALVLIGGFSIAAFSRHKSARRTFKTRGLGRDGSL